MKYPIVWDGKEWRKSTKEEYQEAIVNVPVYGKANYILPDVWDLPVVNTNAMTGSKVVACGRSFQLRFACPTDTAQMVRAYKIALDKDKRAGVRFNYMKVGTVFQFETTFCGSGSGLEKFEAFIEKLANLSGIKSIQVRIRDEKTGEISRFKRFEYNKYFLGTIRYLRDSLNIQEYNNIKISHLKVVPDDSIYKVKVIV